MGKIGIRIISVVVIFTLAIYGNNIFAATYNSFSLTESFNNYRCNFKPIACGNGYVAVVKNDGTVWYWGRDISSTTMGAETIAAKKIELLTNVVSIVATGSTYGKILALKSDGTVWEHLGGEIEQINGLTEIIDIATSSNHSLALKKDGTVWSWGINNYGALGTGEYDENDSYIDKYGHRIYNVPKIVPGLKDIMSVYVDAEKSIALKKDGSVWFWGNLNTIEYDGEYRIQRGENLWEEFFPKQIKGLENIVDINLHTASKTSNMHLLFLKKDGSVWTFGANNNGQVDPKSEELFIKTPTKVKGLANIINLADGITSSIAISLSGDIWEWGGTKRNLRKIQNNNKFKSVFLGTDSNLAIDENDKIWVWGKILKGELDDESINKSDTPILSKINIPIASLGEIKVILDGRPLVFDVHPEIINGRTLVPIRAIAEALNMKVGWNGETQEVSLNNETTYIKLNISSNKVTVNNNLETIDIEPRIVSGRTLVPVRFLSETIGQNVQWDGETKTVVISN